MLAMRCCLLLLGALLTVLTTDLHTNEDQPWPTPVVDHVPVAAGEHPRLFLRRCDLPALRERAQTPEGQALLARLRVQLNGSDGRSLPEARRSPEPPFGDGSRPIRQPIGALSLSHPMGYGFLYQITGDQHYADLAAAAMQLILDGYRDRDDQGRYSFIKPSGALRAGPSLGWVAAGYDMAYDGWDPAFRRTVAQAIEHYNGDGGHDHDRGITLSGLTRARMRHYSHPPQSNHWGMQVGGAALALMAITGDPEIDDQDHIDALLAHSRNAMRRVLNIGFGNTGYFAEGDGCGSMASHIVLLSALQAWRVSQGLDYFQARPNASWTSLKYVFLTVPPGSSPEALRHGFPTRGGYPHNVWDRFTGLSGAGYFAIGYGAVNPVERLPLWWFYNTHLRQFDEQRRAPWDSTSPYPHHTVLAFINTPFGAPLVNPQEVLPRAIRDHRYGFFAFRNRWQDRNDILITQLTQQAWQRFRHGPEEEMTVWHHGQREYWGTIPTPVETYRSSADGSAIIGNDSHRWMIIDFSGASGANGLLIEVNGRAASDQVLSLAGHRLAIRHLGPGGATAQVDDGQLIIGNQRLQWQDGQPRLSHWAGPWQGPTVGADGRP